MQENKVVALNYIYTVWGLWYSGKLFKENGWEEPKTWADFLTICKEAKAKGIGGLAHQGKYPYYINVAIMDLIAKTGGLDAMKAIDNLDPKAFVGSDAAKAGVEAIYEVVEKGYLMPGTNGLTHTESQARWNQYKAVFITSGSWLENEQLKQTPDDFDMTFMPMPVLPDSVMPFQAIRAGFRGAVHHPGQGEEPACGQGVHADDALQGVVDALRQGGELPDDREGRRRHRGLAAARYAVDGGSVQGRR